VKGDGPFADPHVQHVIKKHVLAVFGECPVEAFASKPSAVATECNNPLPNACPAEGPSDLWGLNRIKAPQTWAALPGIVNTNPSSTVMVIDSGINEAHVDLAANLVPSLTVTGYEYPPQSIASGNAIGPQTDPNGHGTHVAGTVFARWNNGAGTPVGVVGNALGGSCGCSLRNPQTPAQTRVFESLCLNNCIR
jgi:subtilisin family serine protease